MAKQKLKAPWPYIGGKSRVAKLIWGHLGNVRNYIEPFAGSAAVLLARPHPGRIETLNDVNHFLANAWRAIQKDPQGVAAHADWPVTEADLHARHLWLMFSQTSAEFRRKIKADPDHFDPKIAGWWIWGQCCWIGSGWCDSQGVTGEGEISDRRPHLGNQLPDLGGDAGASGRGVHASGLTQKRPLLSLGNGSGGKGVQAKVPQAEAKGVSRKLPRLTGGREGDLYYGGIGVNAESRPQLGDAFARGRGVHGNDHAESQAERRAWLIAWMNRLADRLRTVRVCCGEWTRVCSSPSVTTRLGTTGIFLDPPYALDIERMHAFVRHFGGQGPLPELPQKATNRDGNLYGSDKGDVDQLVARVHVYAATMGAKPEVRIVLAGYDGEHNALEDRGWEAVEWKSSGYSNRGKSKDNNSRERLWISPHCRMREEEVRPMFSLWEKETVCV